MCTNNHGVRRNEIPSLQLLAVLNDDLRGEVFEREGAERLGQLLQFVGLTAPSAQGRPAFRLIECDQLCDGTSRREISKAALLNVAFDLIGPRLGINLPLKCPAFLLGAPMLAKPDLKTPLIAAFGECSHFLWTILGGTTTWCHRPIMEAPWRHRIGNGRDVLGTLRTIREAL